MEKHGAPRIRPLVATVENMADYFLPPQMAKAADYEPLSYIKHIEELLIDPDTAGLEDPLNLQGPEGMLDPHSLGSTCGSDFSNINGAENLGLSSKGSSPFGTSSNACSSNSSFPELPSLEILLQAESTDASCLTVAPPLLPESELATTKAATHTCTAEGAAAVPQPAAAPHSGCQPWLGAEIADAPTEALLPPVTQPPAAEGAMTGAEHELQLQLQPQQCIIPNTTLDCISACTATAAAWWQQADSVPVGAALIKASFEDSGSMVTPSNGQLLPVEQASQWVMLCHKTVQPQSSLQLPMLQLVTAGSLGSDTSSRSAVVLPEGLLGASAQGDAVATAGTASAAPIVALQSLCCPFVLQYSLIAATGNGVPTPLRPDKLGLAAYGDAAGTGSSTHAEGRGNCSTGDSSSSDSGSSSTLCPHCAGVKQLGDRCCATVMAGRVDAHTREQIAELKLLAARCPCSTPCLFTPQLPATADFGTWHISMSMARFSDRKQRAGAGTGTARNFNFNANSPLLLGNHAKLSELQAQSTEVAAAAAHIDIESTAAAAAARVTCAGDGQYYSIRSSQKTSGGSIISYGLARDGRQPADSGRASGSSSSGGGSNSSSRKCCKRSVKPRIQPVNQWVEGGVHTSKTESKYRGWRFDLHEWAFFVAVADQSSDRTAPERQPAKRQKSR